MAKILSLIIPTYNMASLLPRCLNSLIESNVLPKLDIIIVNDGSKDNSLEVARSYAARCPEIHIIDKQNGNYGSTVNAALPVATGTYVKILDSDDWFDTKSLEAYIPELESLDGRADISVTHFQIVHRSGPAETVKYNDYGREPFVYKRIYELDYVLGSGHIRYFLMHSLAYRTKMLQENGYHQTEGISYTDIQWASYPIYWARNIVFHDIVLYRYNLSRDGQTMDPTVISRSLPQLEKMTDDLISFYRNADRTSMSASRQMFLKQLLRNRIRLLMKTHLLDIPRSSFDKDEFARVNSKLISDVEEFGMDPVRVFPENKIIRIDVCKYWQKHNDRLPAWLEHINRITDKIVRKLFVVLFH